MATEDMEALPKLLQEQKKVMQWANIPMKKILVP